MAKKTIVLVGTLDTKGKEIDYCSRIAQDMGFNTIVIDVGILNVPYIKGDLTRETIAQLGGNQLSDLIKKGDKNFAIETMANGVKKAVSNLYGEGRLDGLLSLGGGQGTYLGTSAMQVLPLGIPKVMVSTLTSGDVHRFVGIKDIVMINPVTDILGINCISGQILKNAVAALAGMIEVAKPVERSNQICVGLSMLGTTTKGAMQVVDCLEKAGLEIITFHANGPGGDAMEELVKQGFFDAMLEYSPHQITAGICHGIFASDSPRLMAAIEKNIPQLIVPGGLEKIIQGPYEEMPEEHQKRPHIIHNKNITLVRANKEEMIKVAELVASRLNHTQRPVKVVIPLKGFCAPNKVGGVFYNPEADEGFIQKLEESTKENPYITIVKVDAHINDREFALRVAEEFQDLLHQANIV